MNTNKPARATRWIVTETINGNVCYATNGKGSTDTDRRLAKVYKSRAAAERCATRLPGPFPVAVVAVN